MPSADIYMYGGADSDLIRAGWWTDNVDDSVAMAGDLYIWGDYRYGVGTTPMMPGEDALDATEDKERWGDDDRIYGAKGDGTKNQRIHGGDGDDYIKAGDTWLNSFIFGQNGDDTIFVP